jgi:hypothetical protein
MEAVKICSLALEVPDPELTVTSQGTGRMISRASSSVNGSPKMVFFGLLAMFESKWDISVMFCYLTLKRRAKVQQYVGIAKVCKPFKLKAWSLKPETDKRI